VTSIVNNVQGFFSPNQAVVLWTLIVCWAFISFLLSMIFALRRRLRRQLERERRWLGDEARLRLLSAALDQVMETIMITDRGGVIQYVNPAFCESTGYQADEIVGLKPSILKTEQTDVALYREIWRRLDGGQSWRGDTTSGKKGGGVLHEYMSITPVRDAAGRISNFVAVGRHTGHERSLQKRLREAAKMEAVGILAGGIAHDFNNILMVILGGGQLAERLLPDDHPAKEELRRIVAAGRRASELVRQLQSYSRHGATELRPLRMQLVVKESLKHLRETLPPEVTIESDIDADCPPVAADATGIHQMLVNLWASAQYQCFGRPAWIFSVNLRQEHSALTRAASAHLRVITRTGDDQSEAKSRDDLPIDDGGGLNLAIVSGIVERHRGRILLSERFDGSRQVDIYLPLAQLEAEKPAVTTMAEPPSALLPTASGGHVLLVDDEPAILFTARRHLELYGYTVTLCACGRDALEQYRQEPKRFDVVVSDCFMPGLTGLQLAREILAINPQAAIILLIGSGDENDRRQAENAPVQTVLTKPVEARRLVAAVQQAMGEQG
jgi:PAS domain S-box-containing protein